MALTAERLARLRESAPPVPPNYRPKDVAEQECATCRMYDNGECWGYGRVKVQEAYVCDSWAAERLREGVFSSAGKRVYFQDGQTLRDAADLYAMLKEEAPSGSPNVENDLVRAFVQAMQSGALLSNDQLAKLLQMLKKYGPELRAYRASSDQSQNLLDVPDGNTARILSR